MPGAHALHLAAINGDAETVQLLLARGVDVDVPAKGGDTPLICAAFYGRLSAMTELLDAGASASAVSRQYGWTPMLAAASNKQAASVQYLLRRGVDPKQQEKDGANLIHVAASVGDVATAEIALGAGVDPLLAVGKLKSTALHVAASGDELAMLHWLLDKRANIHATDTEGRTPLHWAALTGATKAVALLLDRGAQLRRKDNAGWVAIHSAASKDKAEVVKLLLKHNSKVDPLDNEGGTPLHNAAWYGALEAARALIDGGAKINSKGKLGRTAYALAVERGHKEVAAYLKSRGGR